jgi:hypothetical protein
MAGTFISDFEIVLGGMDSSKWKTATLICASSILVADDDDLLSGAILTSFRKVKCRCCLLPE